MVFPSVMTSRDVTFPIFRVEKTSLNFDKVKSMVKRGHGTPVRKRKEKKLRQEKFAHNS